jgi:hypothetical protein
MWGLAGTCHLSSCAVLWRQGQCLQQVRCRGVASICPPSPLHGGRQSGHGKISDHFEEQQKVPGIVAQGEVLILPSLRTRNAPKVQIVGPLLHLSPGKRPGQRWPHRRASTNCSAGGSGDASSWPGRVKGAPYTNSTDETPLSSFRAALSPSKTHGRWSGHLAPAKCNRNASFSWWCALSTIPFA